METINHFKEKAIRIFLKNGGDGTRVKVFEHLEAIDQEKILRKINLEQHEMPVIGGFDDTQSTLLLTDRRLVQILLEDRRVVRLKDVKDVKTDLKRIKLNQKEPRQQLEIITISGGTALFELESGYPFTGLWNVLLFVATHNNSYL